MEGHIYTLPGINTDIADRVSTNLIVNKVWLDVLGMNEPNTIDEFYDMLVAFKTMDPNQNGIADEIPLCVSEVRNVVQLVALFGYSQNENGMFLDMDSDKILHVPTQSDYKDFLKAAV